jgi:hypothetical protein
MQAPGLTNWTGLKMLKTCSNNDQHMFPSHLRACPWCERTKLFGGNDPFPSTNDVKLGKHLKPVIKQKPLPATAMAPTPTSKAVSIPSVVGSSPSSTYTVHSKYKPFRSNYRSVPTRKKFSLWPWILGFVMAVGIGASRGSISHYIQTQHFSIPPIHLPNFIPQKLNFFGQPIQPEIKPKHHAKRHSYTESNQITAPIPSPTPSEKTQSAEPSDEQKPIPADKPIYQYQITRPETSVHKQPKPAPIPNSNLDINGSTDGSTPPPSTPKHPKSTKLNPDNMATDGSN